MDMHLLALNPYHGGSHAAFLDGWQKHSRHRFTTLTLPPHHWKWRMRHSAATLAQQLALNAPDPHPGLLWCTSMLDLAALRGLAPAWVGQLPAIVYFHENQLTYPDRKNDPRDHHFAITHLTSALAAVQSGGAVHFNSAFNRDSFLTAARKLLKQMPGPELDHVPDLIEAQCTVLHPGIDMPPRSPKTSNAKTPLKILWAARWEHDKDPDAFFAALKKLKKRGIDFRLRVLGESFEHVPECFATAQKRFADHIDHWGYLPSRQAYEKALQTSDVIVSTARHEFFGLSVVEAVAAGCFPVLPRRLAYPEVFGNDDRFYYDGTPEGLAAKLLEHAYNKPAPISEAVADYTWTTAAEQLDAAIDR